MILGVPILKHFRVCTSSVDLDYGSHVSVGVSYTGGKLGFEPYNSKTLSLSLSCYPNVLKCWDT